MHICVSIVLCILYVLFLHLFYFNAPWSCFSNIFEKHELIHKSRGVIEIIKDELGENPTEATYFIRFLNSKNKQELEELEIEDKNETILEIKNVLTKKGLMLQLEEKS